MLRFGLIGAGRIGQMHARNIASGSCSELRSVFDSDRDGAREVADSHGAVVAESVDALLADNNVEAVFIASSTDTHIEFIARAARANKAVLCEKPLDLDITRVDRCREEIRGTPVPIQIGFNRRYDPGHRALQQAVAAGEIGGLEQLVITSRDPGLPSLDYLRGSGGLFRDMMIHDFDLARFILDEEFVEISAIGSVQIEPALKQLDDIDSAMVVMRSVSGKLCNINCSRRAVYGYDQRVEALGETGMLISGNRTATELSRFGAEVTAARDPLLNFFVDRYREAYQNQITAFVDAVENNGEPSPNFEDGRRALMLADAAEESLRTAQIVRLES